MDTEVAVAAASAAVAATTTTAAAAVQQQQQQQQQQQLKYSSNNIIFIIINNINNNSSISSSSSSNSNHFIYGRFSPFPRFRHLLQARHTERQHVNSMDPIAAATPIPLVGTILPNFFMAATPPSEEEGKAAFGSAGLGPNAGLYEVVGPSGTAGTGLRVGGGFLAVSERKK